MNTAVTQRPYRLHPKAERVWACQAPPLRRRRPYGRLAWQGPRASEPRSLGASEPGSGAGGTGGLLGDSGRDLPQHFAANLV